MPIYSVLNNADCFAWYYSMKATNFFPIKFYIVSQCRAQLRLPPYANANKANRSRMKWQNLDRLAISQHTTFVYTEVVHINVGYTQLKLTLMLHY